MAPGLSRAIYQDFSSAAFRAFAFLTISITLCGMRKLIKIYKYLCFTGTVLGLILYCGATQSPSSQAMKSVGAKMFIFCCAIPIVLWFFWICAKVGFQIGDSVVQASRPVPQPGEIYLALTKEYGRPATVEEVGAVHQMLHDQHNQDLVNAGLGLGALLVIHDVTK